jgi:hypothetical protein
MDFDISSLFKGIQQSILRFLVSPFGSECSYFYRPVKHKNYKIEEEIV